MKKDEIQAVVKEQYEKLYYQFYCEQLKRYDERDTGLMLELYDKIQKIESNSEREKYDLKKKKNESGVITDPLHPFLIHAKNRAIADIKKNAEQEYKNTYQNYLNAETSEKTDLEVLLAEHEDYLKVFGIDEDDIQVLKDEVESIVATKDSETEKTEVPTKKTKAPTKKTPGVHKIKKKESGKFNNLTKNFFHDIILAALSVTTILTTSLTAPSVIVGVGVAHFAARGNRIIITNYTQKKAAEAQAIKNAKIDKKNSKIREYNDKIAATGKNKKIKHEIVKKQKGVKSYRLLSAALQILSMITLVGLTGNIAPQIIIGLLANIITLKKKKQKSK